MAALSFLGLGLPVTKPSLGTLIRGGYDLIFAGTWWVTVLPGLVLASVYIGLVTRMTRSSMLEVLNADYVRTARGKGLPQRLVIYRHALGNALIPVLTILGLQFGSLLSGAIVTETVFSWPGIGRLTLSAISNRDYALVQGCILAVGLTYVAVNLLTDVAYTLANPCMRA